MLAADGGALPPMTWPDFRAAFLPLYIAWRNLLRHYRRNITALLSVGFGVAALLAASGFTAGMFEEFREATIHSRYGHVQVTVPGYHQNGRSDPWSYLLPGEAPAQLLDGVGDGRIAPRLLVNGLASHGDVTLPFIGEGYDPAVDMTDDRSLRMTAGRRLAAGDRDHLIVGRGMARRLGVGAGDSLVLLVTNPGGQLGAVEAEIAGVFASFSSDFDAAALLLPIELARRLVGVEGAHAWLVFLDETAKSHAVADHLSATLPRDRFDVQPWDALAEFYRRATELFVQQLQVVKVVVVAIILLGIGNTMMSSVLERTGEIGTVLALGARRREVLRGFLLEAAILGVVGALLGVLLAAALAWLVAMAGIQMPPPPGFSRGYPAALQITPGAMLEALAIAVATTTLAALYPALRASRMVIVDAIRELR